MALFERAHDLTARDPRRTEDVPAKLGSAVRDMHAHTADPTPRDPFEDVVLRQGLTHLAEAADRVDRLAAVRDRLADLVRARHAAVARRSRFGLVHGRLGPDHAFPELRFGAHYRHFANPDLDRARLRLYRLATYLSLVAGPLRLLDDDFPHRAGMPAVVEHDIGRALAQLPSR
ncbi:hypothetical protein ACRAKI_17585 [Saccharothrix isguenensis]